MTADLVLIADDDSNSFYLVLYNEACKKLAEAKTTDEVKDVRDRALALRLYAQQANNRQLEADAFELRHRAERRLGEMMAEQKATVGANKGGWKEYTAKSCGASETPQDRPPTLAEAGINKHLAKSARRAASKLPEEFERVIKDGRGKIIEAADRAHQRLYNVNKPPAIRKKKDDEVVTKKHEPVVSNMMRKVMRPVDVVGLEVRNLVLDAMQLDVPREDLGELFSVLRTAIDDLEKIAEQELTNGHNTARQSA